MLPYDRNNLHWHHVDSIYGFYTEMIEWLANLNSKSVVLFVVSRLLLDKSGKNKNNHLYDEPWHKSHRLSYGTPILYSGLIAPGTHDFVKYSAAARTLSHPYGRIHPFEIKYAIG